MRPSREHLTWWLGPLFPYYTRIILGYTRILGYNIKSQRNTTSDHHLRQSFFLQPFGTMAAQQRLLRGLDVKFRVLIIGRANAGKTSILQRVCDTTESPEIYRLDPEGTRHQVYTRSW